VIRSEGCPEIHENMKAALRCPDNPLQKVSKIDQDCAKLREKSTSCKGCRGYAECWE